MFGAVPRFFGTVVRFVIVYRFDWNAMDRAYRKDRGKENLENLKVGLLVIVIIFAVGFIEYLTRT